MWSTPEARFAATKNRTLLGRVLERRGREEHGGQPTDEVRDAGLGKPDSGCSSC